MPPANNVDENGIIDRLAKRLFASPDSPFTAFADKQRIDRLESCRHFERILLSCQQKQQSASNSGANNNAPEKNEMDMKDMSEGGLRSGARIARFFKWNANDSEGQNNNDATGATDSSQSNVFSEAAASFTNDNEGEKNQSSVQTAKTKITPRFSKDCAIETHELWACRALALGCGNYIGDLRRCWSEVDESKKRKALGAEDGITFEDGEEKSCRDIQVDMSKCVSRHAAELAERVQAAKKQ